MSIVYTRVSSAAQGPDNLSIQKNYILNYLNQNGIVINDYYEEVSSAYNGKQSKLNHILNNFCDIKLYILNVSRFSRNIITGVRMLELAKNKNIKIYFVQEDLCTENPSNIHQIKIKILETEKDSEQKSINSNNWNKIMKVKGWKFGKPKFGFKSKITKKVRNIVSCKEEEAIIDFIIQAREGKSLDILNKKLKKIIKKADPIQFYDLDGKTKINKFYSPNTLTFYEISNLLNDYSITKRNKLWTASSVRRVYNDVKKAMNSLINNFNNVTI